MIERYIGIPRRRGGPNIASVYGRRLRLENQLFLAISQSGRSDDLVELASSAKAAGALTVAIVNATDGPLVPACDIVLPMVPDRSSAWRRARRSSRPSRLRCASPPPGPETNLGAAIGRLPDRLTAAAELDWSELVEALAERPAGHDRPRADACHRPGSLLKLKETCQLHAEAFSGAEFLHGPVALISSRCPVLMFMPTDVAAEGMRQLAARLRAEGTACSRPSPASGPGWLPRCRPTTRRRTPSA